MENFEAKMNIKLRILGESTSIPHILIVAHARVPVSESVLIKEKLISMYQSEMGR